MNQNVYWLDSLFCHSTKYIKEMHTLEGQMNSLSKLIVLSFFIMKVFLPMKIATVITISMLFITSVLYYYLSQKNSIRENFEEYQKEKKTNLSNSPDFIVDSRRRETYIPERSPIPIQYKTILPLESYTSSLQQQNQTIPSGPVLKQHPQTLHGIQPRENLYSQYTDRKQTSFLQFAPSIPQRESQLIMDTTTTMDHPIFQRTNIDHLDTTENLTPDQYQEQVDQMYFQNQMLLRENYANKIKELNRVRDAHYKIAPIHTNFRVRGGGGPSFSKYYAGPRGTR